MTCFSKNRSQCQQCISEYNKTYYQVNREQILINVKTYRKDNNERRLAQRKTYYQDNKDRLRTKSIAYYEDHREERQAKSKEYYEAHKEERQAKNKKYYEAHREEHRLRNKAWENSNSDKVKKALSVRKAKRRAIMTGATATLTTEDWQEIWEINDGLCLYCGDLAAHMDHIVPLNPRPGTPQGHHTKNNVTPACSPCNLSKSNKDPLVFLFEVRDKLAQERVILGQI